MIGRAAFIASMLVASAAHAQVFVDGSDAHPRAELAVAIWAVTANMFDPTSAQFRKVGRPFPQQDGTVSSQPTTAPLRRDTFCGFVNAKNLYGGYTGFRLFAVDSASGEAYVWGDAGLPDLMIVRLSNLPNQDATIRDALIEACRSYQ